MHHEAEREKVRTSCGLILLDSAEVSFTVIAKHFKKMLWQSILSLDSMELLESPKVSMESMESMESFVDSVESLESFKNSADSAKDSAISIRRDSTAISQAT